MFTLPEKMSGNRPPPDYWPIPKENPLAYVEWYSTLARAASPRHGMMYQIRKVQTPDKRRAQGAIIPLQNIRQSCMLFPKFPADGPPSDWNKDNVLEIANEFYVNNWSSKYNYQTIY